MSTAGTVENDLAGSEALGGSAMGTAESTSTPETPGGKKRSRSKDGTKSGLTPEAKNRALEKGGTVLIKPKKKTAAAAVLPSTSTSAPTPKSKPEVKDSRSDRVELRLFKDVGKGKTNLTRTDWRKLKDEINKMIAATSDLSMMEGLIKAVHNAKDKNEPIQYGAFVYERKEQLDNLYSMLSKIEVEFGIVMSMPGGKKNKPRRPTIELKMTTNKHIQEGALFEIIRKQNNLKGKFENKSYKDFGILRVYSITPSKEMLEDIAARGLEEFKFGLDTYAIVIRNAGNNTKADAEGMMDAEGKMDTN